MSDDEYDHVRGDIRKLVEVRGLRAVFGVLDRHARRAFAEAAPDTYADLFEVHRTAIKRAAIELGTCCSCVETVSELEHWDWLKDVMEETDDGREIRDEDVVSVLREAHRQKRKYGVLEAGKGVYDESCMLELFATTVLADPKRAAIVGCEMEIEELEDSIDEIREALKNSRQRLRRVAAAGV